MSVIIIENDAEFNAVGAIDEAPRQYWKTLDAIANLKCGITKGKKLEALKQVFYLTPQSLPDVIKDPAILQALTTQELKSMAKKRSLTGYTKMKKPDLVICSVSRLTLQQKF